MFEDNQPVIDPTTISAEFINNPGLYKDDNFYEILSGYPANTIENYIKERNFEFTRKYVNMGSWDDFIILSSNIREDDLFIVIYARKGSLSRTGDLESMPPYISKHFSNSNIVLVYPAQFGVS